jgi:hypothetical protein
MSSSFKKTIYAFVLIILSCSSAFSQYKYTRFSIDANGGFSVPNTSITGTAGGYGEVGFRLATSRYLSGRMAIGIGTLTGSQDVDKVTGPRDNVANYTKFNSNYYYFSGSGLLNLERVFKLRNLGKFFYRFNPFLVIGAGYMYPDIEVNRVDGQFKNYKKNVRFIANNFGLDFKYFLNNRFDLNIGAEYKLVQTYYLDGAYSDRKFDGMINAYVGVSYNIGASADRKHLEWFNLDGREDIMFVPFNGDLKKGDEPLADNRKPKNQIDSSYKDEITDKADSLIAQINKPNQDTLYTTPAKDIVNTKEPIMPIDTVVKKAVVVAPNKQELVNLDTIEYRKIGRHSDIKGKSGNATPKQVVGAIPESKIETGSSLNDINGIVRPMGKYNVIVGTYSGARYAYPFRDKIRKQGFQAALFKDSDKSKMVRVCVYYGNDRKEANRQLRLYMKKFDGQAWIHIYDPK